MSSRLILRPILGKNLSNARFVHGRARSDRQGRKKCLPLTRTSIIMQEGPKIHQVCQIVEKICDIDDTALVNDEPSLGNENRSFSDGTVRANLRTEDFQDLRKDTITDEINSRAALEALKEITKLGDEARSSRNCSNGRERALDQLTDTIAKTRDNDTIIEGLALLGKDRLGGSWKNRHRDRLCDEALIRATNGQLEIRQLIEFVKILSRYEDPTYREILDATWIGIKTRESDIDEKNLNPLFRILALFRENRSIVGTILEKKLLVNWWRLSGTDMSEILRVTFDQAEARCVLVCARKWSKLHINTARESELARLIETSTRMKFFHEQSLEKSLERYMRDRGTATKDPALIALIMNYCGKNRLRNTRIFDTCADYIVKRFADIPLSLMAPIFVPFGYLNFRFSGSDEFLRKIQSWTDKKFSYLTTNDAMNIVLSLIYLGKAPLGLVDRLFAPSFFERLRHERRPATLTRLGEKLFFIDRAMALESEDYACRVIPGTTVRWEKKIFTRSRIKRATDLVYRKLSKIVGGEDKLSRAVMLGQLSAIDLYTLDILVHSDSIGASIFSFTNNPENSKTAIFINLPEHYCRGTTNLIGPREMRIRHIEKLGFRVVALDYGTLLRLRNYPNEIENYLTERLRSVDDT